MHFLPFSHERCDPPGKSETRQKIVINFTASAESRLIVTVLYLSIKILLCRDQASSASTLKDEKVV